MFDPAKLSPPFHPDGVLSGMVLAFHPRTSSGNDEYLWLSPADAAFFIAARKCFDIGERRGWYVERDGDLWRVVFADDDECDDLQERFGDFVDTQAEAMQRMIEADEWLTAKEKDGGK